MSHLTDPFELFFQDCLWQSTLCLLLGLIGSFWWAKRPARSHRILVLSLGAALLAPILSLTVRHYNWGMLPRRALVAVPNGGRLNASAPARILPQAATSESSNVSEKPVDSVIAGETSPHINAVSPAHTAAANTAPRIAWQTIAVSLWVLLSGLAASRLGLSILRGLALIKRALPNADISIQNAADLAASKLNIAATPEVWVSKEVVCPVIWCWHRRPFLVIPAGAVSSRGNLDWEGLFCHELAHWKRRDHLAELFAEIGAVVFPWQPLVWWARTRLSHLADAVCDEWALHCGRQGPAYASSLLELLPQIRPVGAIPAVRNRRKLERRIRRILNHQAPQPLAGVLWSRGVGVGLILVPSALALLQGQGNSRAVTVGGLQDREGPKSENNARGEQPKKSASASARRLVTGDPKEYYSRSHTLSPDGKYLARVSYPGRQKDGELILVETATGIQKTVAGRCEWTVAVWSEDGRRIAFDSRPDGVSSPARTNRIVRVVNVDTGKTDVLLQGDIWIEEWSGEHELLLGQRAGDWQDVVLVDLKSGKQTDFEGNPICRGYPRRLSPDAKLIAYCVIGENRSDLCLHDLASSNRVVLADFPGKKSDPLWSPDGRHLLFRCSQPGAGHEHEDLWCIRVADGKFVGTPSPVMGDVSGLKFLNWARNGQLAYSIPLKQRSGLYALPVDPTTARTTGPIRRLLRGDPRTQVDFMQDLSLHTWSPDSKEIAFLSNLELHFISPSNGETLRRLPLSKLKGTQGFGIAWSPDLQTIAIPGKDDQERRGLFAVNIKTAELRLLFEVPTNSWIWGPSWLPDGKSIVLDGLQPRGIYVVKLENGARRQLTSALPAGRSRPHFLASVALDGKSVFTANNNLDDGVLSITIETEEIREFLPQVKAAGLRMDGFSWLPNSRFVVFEAQDKLWASAVPDGKPFEVSSLPKEFEGYSMSPPKCSPDGKTITFAVDSDKVEYWVMENFLPPEKVAAK